MRDCFIKTLCALAKNDPRVILLTGDIGFSVLDEYRKSFPAQFINAGVAEQNMIAVASGMALEGNIVFVYSIGNFPTLRCLEMIRNDAAYHGANVKIVSIGAGFSYGALGISHHATEDLTIMRSIPGVACFSPSTLTEVFQSTQIMCRMEGTCYLRLDKDKGQEIQVDEEFVVGRPRLIMTGKDVALFVTGGILSEVTEAAKTLNERGISASIYSVHSFHPLEPTRFAEAARKHRAIVTIEEHTIVGGLGSLVLESLADLGVFPERFLRIGLERCFSSTVGSQKYLRKQYNMDAESICNRVEDLIRRT